MSYRQGYQPRTILGIETSCDETAAAVVTKTGDRVNLLSNIVTSSIEIQTKYGGIVPEQAARQQIVSILPVVTESIEKANLKPEEIDAIAVTYGPGLIGSLLVGVETAKTLSIIWNKPLVPVNHLVGHFYANWIDSGQQELPRFPLVGLLVSGGHTDLVLFEDHGRFRYLGGTRDDAAGEAFDKTARLLNLPYPGGPVISKLALTGNHKTYPLPRPMLDSKDLDFSFSGLKTAVLNRVQSLKYQSDELTGQQVADLSASIQEAVVDVLAKKTVAAAQLHQVDQIMIAGGVAANKRLTERLTEEAEKSLSRGKLFIPPPPLCTDNGAYIAAAAFFNYHPLEPTKIQASPGLSLA